MTDDTLKHSDSPHELNAQIQQLKQHIADLESEKDYLAIESKLAVQDAELARSFSSKNYERILDELFQAPAKRLGRKVALLFSLSIITLLALAFTIASPYFITQPYQQHLEQEVALLHSRLDHIASQGSTKQADQAGTPQNYGTTSHSLQAELEETPETLTVATDDRQTTPLLINTQQPIVLEESVEEPIERVEESTPAPLKEQAVITSPANEAATPIFNEKERTINQQSQTILEYVHLASTKNGFPEDYQENKTNLAQLYLIIMQNASNDNIYYESYLKALDTLEIAEAIKPKTVADLVKIDTDFLQAAFAAYLITQKKHQKQWRYRDTDRGFDSYYNPSIGYDLGSWKIVNSTQDYLRLPEIFALNVKRIAQQLAFNQQIEALQLPQSLYYLSYEDSAKDQAVGKLMDADRVDSTSNKLVLDTRFTALSLSTNAAIQLQTRLADEGFMEKSIINGIVGPNTRTALKAYQQAKQLPATGGVYLALLESLGINTTFYDIRYE